MALGWTPETFWKSTLNEYLMAVEGWNEMNSSQSGKPKPLTRDEYNELKLKYPDKT